ncbi:MAG: hypothetical protein K0A89_11540 [ANME-2 cluster archaeon]|nr:hypothetical protein [ANME-2 cluster archaeon]
MSSHANDIPTTWTPIPCSILKDSPKPRAPSVHASPNRRSPFARPGVVPSGGCSSRVWGGV